MSRVKLGEVAFESRDTIKNTRHNLPVVGLEHLKSSEIILDEWSENRDNTFTKVFSKGQVLFGRRRAYLKKAVVAPFDGICSGDITVIAAKPDKLLSEFLPFVIQNDSFFDYAVEKSAGSLSPRAKWEHIKDFEFELPSLTEQKRLAQLLWTIIETKNAYKALIEQTEQLVKSQFIELFGDPVTNPKEWQISPLGEVAECFIGLTYKPADIVDDGIVVLRSSNIQNGELDFADTVRVNTKIKDKLFVKDGDILMCSRNGSAQLVGKTAFILNLSEQMTFGAFMTIIRSKHSYYLLPFFRSNAFSRQITMAKTTTINQITKSMLDNILVPIPPLALQNRFAEFVRQADKSKFELKRTLSELDATYKALLREKLG